MRVEVVCNGVKAFSSELDAEVIVTADGVEVFRVTQTPAYLQAPEGGRIMETVNTVATAGATEVLNETQTPPVPPWFTEQQAHAAELAAAEAGKAPPA